MLSTEQNPSNNPPHLIDVLPLLPFPNAKVIKLSPITSGHSNQNFQLQVGEEKYFLRLDAQPSRIFSLNRRFEISVLQQMALLGFAPSIHHHDLEQGILITDFIQGRYLQKDDLQQQDICTQFQNFFKALRHLNTDNLTFTLDTTINHYFAQLDTKQTYFKQLIPFHEHYIDVISKLAQQPQFLQICHNDLNRENLLVTQDKRIMAIDWEYSTVSHLQLEIAKLANVLDLDESQIIQIIPKMETAFTLEWQQIRQLARYIDTLWYALMAQIQCSHYWVNIFKHQLAQLIKN